MATQGRACVFLKQKMKKITHLVAHLKAETKSLNKGLTHPTATNQQTRNTLDEPDQALVQTFQKRINVLEKELQELKTSNHTCQNHMVKLQKELAALKISSQVCREQRDKLLIVLNYQTASQTLQAEKNVLSETNNELQKQVCEIALQLDTLQNKHKTASQAWQIEMDSLQNEHKTASQAWHTENDALKNELRHLKTAKNTWHTDKYAMQNELKQLKTAKNTWQTDKCALEKELKHLKTAKNAWQQDKYELQNKLRQLKTVKNDMQNDWDVLRNELKQLKIDKQTCQADKDALQAGVQQLKVAILARQEEKSAVCESHIKCKNQLQVASFLCKGNKKQVFHLMETSGKRVYQRDFLLALQFKPACVQKPTGLQPIDNVVLDNIEYNQFPSCVVSAQHCGARKLSMSGSQCSTTVILQWNPKPWKFITTLSNNDHVKLKKAENAWRPSMKTGGPMELLSQTQLFKKLRSILNKLTPNMFDRLIIQVTELAIDTEAILKGVIDLIFEKAIHEPTFSFQYALMCQSLATLEVPRTSKPSSTIRFIKLLFNRCHKELQRDQEDDVVFERMQRDLECASSALMRNLLLEELENTKDRARQRSIGYMKFIGELFKLKMLTRAFMHHCVDNLLNKQTEQSLECLCQLLTTVGKDLDFGISRNHIDQCFIQMTKIIRDSKVSSRLRFMVQDLKDMRHRHWVSRRPDQAPKTLYQIHQNANKRGDER